MEGFIVKIWQPLLRHYDATRKQESTINVAILYLAWLALFFILFTQSWVSEDAYITFRVIDNFVHGYGLRWNITERVQVYTHPLWLLLHLPFAFLSDNLFKINILLSLFCSSSAVGIVLLTFRKSLGVTLACFMLPLFLSKAFIEYAGSGLETSLSFLLFSMLGYAIVHCQKHAYFPLIISLLSSLLLLNRLDHIILIAPLLLVLSLQRNHWQVFVGAIPLLCWFAFSLVYYGFLLPNTKYAKLDTGLSLSAYISQGLEYGFIWLTQDTASAITVMVAVFYSFATLRNTWNKAKTQKNNDQPTSLSLPLWGKEALALGIILNIAYVISIGGDYMMGRFFAVIFFAGCWLLLASVNHLKSDMVFAAVIVLLLAYATSYFVRDIRGNCEACVPIKGRVLDAQRIFGNNALFISLWPPKMRSEGQYKFAYEGRRIAAENPPPIKPLMYVGMIGYYAGPHVILLDELALADPLLARLPARTDRPFYVGHYRRRIPRGYIHAIKTGKLDAMEPSLARYYEKLRLITQGDMWDKKRLQTIIRFNFGQYNDYRSAFLHPPR